MTKNSDEKEQLKKLKVSNLLELALFTPYSYDDYIIKSYPIIGANQLIEATIESIEKTPKILKIKLYCKNYHKYIRGVIFNASYYHEVNFKPNRKLFLYGKIEDNYGLQIVQPKIVESSQNIGQIVPKYKSPLKNDEVIFLMKKYLTKEGLQKYCLSDEKIDTLLKIHFPDENFYIDYIKNNNSFSQKYLYVLKYVEIYNHIKKLSKLKTSTLAITKLTNNPTPFIKSLPFTLTNDQQKVINEVKEDFSKEQAAKRVIMGDVGCGKTMVILASAFMAIPHRSILLAPTTVLAKQIYEEALKYLSKWMKIGFVSNKTKEEDLSQYDFIIGTHALLYRELPHVALIMIDEQHRFGTNQRKLINELLKKDDKSPHFLQFSATPIPRTMAMIHSNYVDISIIKELPFKKDIETKILYPQHFHFLVEHIKKEIGEGRQVIIVYPLVEESEVLDYQSIDEARGYWEKNFDKVYVTHGKDKEKEDVLEEFAKDGNILLATTLIEVGISLPRLSTIVIVAPERLGLATLHQLRGRVSRNGLKGYCYLFTKKEPTKRLKEFCKTLDGFKIAELDLKLRESGDILKGDKQSGKQFKFFNINEDEDILLEVKNECK